MYLFLDIKIKVLLSRLFCVQIILRCKCNIFITGKIFSYCAEVKGVKSIRETFLGMGFVVNGILKFALRRLRWTSVVFLDINLSVYYFRYFSEKPFTWPGYCRTDYFMNCSSREVEIHSGVSECQLWGIFSSAYKCDLESGEVKQIKTGQKSVAGLAEPSWKALLASFFHIWRGVTCGIIKALLRLLLSVHIF